MFQDTYSPEEVKVLDEALAELKEISPESFKENMSKFFSWKTGLIKSLSDNFEKSARKQEKGYSQDRVVEDRLLGKDYFELMELVIQKVPGQSLSFAETVAGLAEMTEYIRSIDEMTIEPYKQYIAGFIQKPELLSSLSPDVPSIIEKDMATNSLEKSLETLNTLFGGNESEHTGKFGELFKSNSDYIKTASELGKLRDDNKKNAPLKLIKDVKEVSALCETLIKRCNDPNKTRYVISKPVADALHNTTIYVAKKLDLYGLFKYRLDAVMNVFESNDKKLRGKL